MYSSNKLKPLPQKGVKNLNSKGFKQVELSKPTVKQQSSSNKQKLHDKTREQSVKVIEAYDCNDMDGPDVEDEKYF